MSTNTYKKLSAIIFLIVGIAHAIRAFSGWNLNVNGVELPIWISWVAVILLGFMVYQGLKSRQ